MHALNKKHQSKLQSNRNIVRIFNRRYICPLFFGIVHYNDVCIFALLSFFWAIVETIHNFSGEKNEQK